jgi:arylsulfatase A-like enzyme
MRGATTWGWLWCAWFAAATSWATAATGDDRRQPHVVVIVADDLGYADVGFHGCRDIPTPHLDALAASGVICTSGYVSGPYCSPTRAGLMTGRYQQRFGHEFNAGGPGGGLPLTETTLADRLAAAGYTTALVGKWHLGTRPEQHPLARGFHSFFGFLGGAHPYYPHDGKSPSILRGREPVKEPTYLTDAFAREACAFIDRDHSRPFFLALTFNAVHTPLEADEARRARFAAIADPRRRTYAAMLTALDDAVGAVRRTIRDRGLERDTLVFFISDNGGPTMPGTTGNGARNTPLRGSKRQTLEGGVRVPFVVSWPGTIPPRRYDEPVMQIDIAPTVLAAAGVDAADARFDGVDLLPHLTGRAAAPPHDTLFWRFGAQMAIRRGDWKLVRFGRDETIDREESWPKLFRLSDDIAETHDLAAAEPAKVAELEASWRAWNAELPPPVGRSGGGKANGRRRNR